MAEPFIGEIRMFAGNFPPRGWAFCDGALLPISSNSALFSIVGTIYGGDGRTNFALPDLRGRAPMHAGSGPGLSRRNLGERGGASEVALTESQMAAHSHPVLAMDTSPQFANPEGKSLARGAQGALPYSTEAPSVDMSSGMVKSRFGPGEAHNNLQPLLAINFIIALEGLYPSRS